MATVLFGVQSVSWKSILLMCCHLRNPLISTGQCVSWRAVMSNGYSFSRSEMTSKLATRLGVVCTNPSTKLVWFSHDTNLWPTNFTISLDNTHKIVLQQRKHLLEKFWLWCFPFPRKWCFPFPGCVLSSKFCYPFSTTLDFYQHHFLFLFPKSFQAQRCVSKISINPRVWSH